MSKLKNKKYYRWLSLYLYGNCFNEGEEFTHLGIKFKGVYFCITHSKGVNEIPKKYLKMSKISKQKEYLKRCNCVPIIKHKTNMKISSDFLNEIINGYR